MKWPRRRWLHFGPCENPACFHRMWGEVGVRVTIRNNGKVRYHHCCSIECARELAQKKAASLRSAVITQCSNLECQGLVIGKGIWGRADVTEHNEELFGPFCCQKCLHRHQNRLRRSKPKLLLAAKVRRTMMRPGLRWWK